MEKKGPLRESAAWKNLEKFYSENGSKLNILELFNQDPERFNKFSVLLQTPCDGPLLLDFSKVQKLKNTTHWNIFSLET